MSEPAETPCTLAPLYSLHALAGDDLWRFESHLLDGCSACEDELDADDEVVSVLAYAAEPVAPPAQLKQRLFGEIGVVTQPTALPRETPPGVGEGWQPYVMPGVLARTLHLDADRREVLMLVRASAGIAYPSHRHAGVEEMFMLEGELVFGGTTTYRAGDYIRSVEGSTHATSETRAGCMFLLRASLDNEAIL